MSLHPSFARCRRSLPPGLFALATAAVAGCGPGRVVVLEPPVNAQEVVARLEANERLQAPLQVVFDWEMSEQGVRVDGQGLARLEPPFKGRLDLFLGNNEPAGRAAVVDDDLRIPAELPPQVLPPANLLWSALGVFRPGLGTALLGAERVEGAVHVRYGLPGGQEAVYRLVEGRIVRIEVIRDGSVVQRLTVERDGLQIPVEAVFRDLVEVRELRLVRQSVARTEPFPRHLEAVIVRVRALIGALALCVGVSGCYSFQAGTGLTGVETIAILPFENTTTRLELTQDVQDILLRQLPGSLGLRLAGEDQADVVVRGTITSYDLVAPNYRPGQQGQGAEVLQRQVVLTVGVEILNMRDRTVLWQSSSLRAQGEYLEATETEDIGKAEALETLIQQIVDGAQSNW